MRKFILFALLATLLVGCNQAPVQKTETAGADTNAPTAANRTVYKVKGVIREMEPPKSAKIAHEEIPGYMAAMTMMFEFKNTNEMAGLSVGDQISFDLVVTPDDGWIEKVVRLGKAPAEFANTNSAPQFRRVRDVDPLNEGDVMPDYPFVNEDAKPIRLKDFKGQAIALTFIFTRCPFPTFCPRMNTNFEKAAKEMAKPGGPTNWHFFSITFDTEVDTPERLKSYATRYERDPAKWNFVTSELIEIDAITEQFGIQTIKENGTINHNLRTAIIDANNRVHKIYIGNEWSVDDFVEEMKKAAQVKAGAEPAKE